MMLKELDQVVVTRSRPGSGLRRGDLGVVVAVYEGTDGLEVEFFRADGSTRAVITLSRKDVRSARRSEAVAVRSLRRSA